jgi:uncharacterized protein YdhG (YjbR/CyaY superfamily)
MTFKNIDEYISIQTPEVQVLLEQMRTTIKKAAPKAEEVISYNMPAFKYHGMLVYFAAYKNHIGFMPRQRGIRNSRKNYRFTNKEKVRFNFP